MRIILSTKYRDHLTKMFLDRPIPNVLYHGRLHIYREHCSRGADA